MPRTINEYGETVVRMTLNERGPLTDEERARAIGHFNQHYVGHGKGITTFHKNTKNKHDRIVAKVTLHSDKKKRELVKRLNSKQDDFTYIYKNSYIIANPKNSDKNSPAKESSVNIELKNNPIINAMKNRGVSQEEALEMLNVAVMENPYLLVALTPIDEEYEFTEENAIEYDDKLFYAFMDAYMLDNMNIDNASILGRCNSYDQVAEGIVDTVRKVKREGEKAFDHIKSGRLSPVVAQLKDAIEEITGLSNEKKREMVVTGNGFIKGRRLFFKILTMWFAKPLLFAALPGGPLMLLINIVVTVKGWANVYDEANGESEGAVKRQCIQELEMELKMTREKINDAKSKGDNKAKYQLMRLESRIEQEITRVKFGDPVEKRNLVVKKDPLRG